MKILVADDSATMRKIMEMTFAGQNAQVTAVDSGQAAVEQARQLQPDVVFADASMDMDGYEVAKAIKGDSSLTGTAVIVLASQHNPFDADRAKGAGVDDHVLKPFDSQSVIDKVAQVVGRPRAAAEAGAGAAAAKGPPPPPAQAQGKPSPPQPPPQAGARGGPKSTIAFGTPPPMQKPASPGGGGPPAAPPAQPQAKAEEAPTGKRPVAPAAKPAPPTPPQRQAKPQAQPAAPAAGAAAPDGAGMEKKLEALGLTPEQVQGVMQLSREMVERVVWEVVPDLAETIIREEIRRLTSE